MMNGKVYWYVWKSPSCIYYLFLLYKMIILGLERNKMGKVAMQRIMTER